MPRRCPPDSEQLKNLVAERIQSLPRYTQLLRTHPSDSVQEWIDYPGFDLAQHVHRVAIPSPGDDAELFRAVAYALERPLDLDRPLWECWVIEGLKNNQWAILMKIHHCLADGISAAHILTRLCDDADIDTFTDHVGEFVLLILLATTGMMFLVASQDLLVIFISLELLSLSVYILAGFDKHSPRSSEAALKYFLFGGMSAAFMLFGFSLLYGFSNSTNLIQIAGAIHGSPLNPIVILAIVTTVIGFGFKIAAAPFHFWAPDVYQGAPAPVVGLMSTAPKAAAFAVLLEGC